MSDGFATHGYERVPLARVDARLAPYDWPWARDNAAAIEENWQRRRAERPGLFDGPVLLCRDIAIDGDACTLTLFETTYARFLAFRDAGSPDPGVANAFAAIVPRTADGGVLLGRMGGHTANAGQIYFPCGTPDPDDVRPGGRVDLAGSAARELEEETGLTLPDETGPPAWWLIRGESQLAFLRPVRFAQSAAALVARAETHRACDPAPELAGFVVARGRGDIDPAWMPGFVRAYLEATFGEAQR